MSIREATLEDIPAIVTMGSNFLESSTYKGKLANSPEQMASIAKQLITSNEGALFVSETPNGLVGMIGIVLFLHCLSGEPTAGELFWWVEPHARKIGVRLMRTAEKWARSRSAKNMQMIAPNERVGEFYQLMGYAPVETTFMKAL